MDDADKLRNRATRLFALAMKSREDGHPDYADELTRLAGEAIRQAVDMERRSFGRSRLSEPSILRLR